MKTYIVLLRGINVGGHRKVPMVELRELLTKTGFSDVKTYIQSGNVIFKFAETNAQKIENSIQKSIADHFGFDVSVMVRTRQQLQKIFDDCPFSEDKKINSYFAILSHSPDKDLVQEAYNKTYENEEYEITNDCLYFYSNKGYGNAKFSLNYFERKLKVNATARNYKTMLKLLSLSAEN
ncbi:DUF1697 domain-containing protein [Winogradskyella poriferorum]|uniref:DUF1697 domain-containing protein n=1 Tax=Winogradskyella poriferorum TaxID=307627 RepID=A0ABU7W3Q3_9FLAO